MPRTTSSQTLSDDPLGVEEAAVAHDVIIVGAGLVDLFLACEPGLARLSVLVFA